MKIGIQVANLVNLAMLLYFLSLKFGRNVFLKKDYGGQFQDEDILKDSSLHQELRSKYAPPRVIQFSVIFDTQGGGPNPLESDSGGGFVS